MPRVRRTVSIRVAVPIVLAEVASDTPGKVYEICLDPQNVVFCTCPAWRYFGHSCKHLTQFRKMLIAATKKAA